MNKLDLEEFLNDVADTEQYLYGIKTFDNTSQEIVNQLSNVDLVDYIFVYLNNKLNTKYKTYNRFGEECYRKDCIFHDKNEPICIADTFLLTDTEFDDNKKCK